MTELALAVDIGGTKMAAALVDRTGALHHRAQVQTPHTSRAGGEDEVNLWRTLVDLVQQVSVAAPAEDQITVCGVGCGGPMSPEGERVSPLNIPGWREFPLRARLR